MKTFKEQIADQCELIQDDLTCILDGIDEDYDNPKMLDHACQAVVDRLKVLKDQLDETFIITNEKTDNGGVPVNRFRIKLPENCMVNVNEETGEVIIEV